MANTRNYSEQEEKKKSGRRKFIGFFIAFIVVFCVGMWVGDSYMADIRRLFGGAARAPLEGMKKVLEGASSIASKEELIGAVDSNEDLDPNEKKRMSEQIAEAYKVRDEYEGEYKAGIEQLWDDARKLYEEAKEDGEITGSELRAVVGKLKEATDAAQ